MGAYMQRNLDKNVSKHNELRGSQPYAIRGKLSFYGKRMIREIKREY